MSPNNKVIMTRLADALRNIGEFDEALKYYERALGIDHDYYAEFGMSLIYKEKGDYRKAIEMMRNLYKEGEPNLRLAYEIAECYIEMGQREKAYNELNRVLEQLDNKDAAGPDVCELYRELSREFGG
ncbi:MAG: tetratricopeptide repeat protein [Spirochaetales bacterium]|nr:tetratricopeptide repeat protein [Spirochaetales bacterium]